MSSKLFFPKWYVALLLFLVSSAVAQMTPASRPGWKLTWHDEFDGPNGSGVDASKWVLETGGNGWGNDELEYYTARPENAFLQDGNLIIKAAEEKYTGKDGVTRN